MEVQTEISDESIRGLLCGAFEGGSNYWYSQLDWELPDGASIDDFRKGGSRQGDTYWHWCQLIPLVDEEGFALTLVDAEDGGKFHRITRSDIENGVKIFAKDYPRHFSNFISENDDAITADVFLQCVVFGEVIYG